MKLEPITFKINLKPDQLNKTLWLNFFLAKQEEDTEVGLW
jgi:hypothetical protein